MKRIIFLFLAISITANITVMASMSSSRVREESRFLTDKMAYELRLNTSQLNDVYEINYDFVYAIGDLMDNVVRGEEWALEEYYEALDIRNDDLRWVLSDSQYRRFLGIDYFYRPVYTSGGRWNFRIYITYTNRNYFYFGRPRPYMTYCGGHYRGHFHQVSFYHGRHNHYTHYDRSYRIRENRTYLTHRRSDFGSVNFRPNSSVRPGSTSRPGTAPDRDHNYRTETSRPGRDTGRRNEGTTNSDRRPSSGRDNPASDRSNSGNSKNESPERRSSNRTTSSERRESSNRTSNNSRSASSSNQTRSEISSSRRSSERSSSSERTSRGSSSSRSSSQSSERGNSPRR